MMKVNEKVSLADIQSITVGTATGMTVWYPTQKQHIETFSSGHDIKGIIPHECGFICVERDSVWSFRLRSKANKLHSTSVRLVAQYQNHIVSVCSEKLHVWAQGDSCELKFSHDLDGLKPLGFEVSEYILLLHALKGSTFVAIYITYGEKWTVSRHHVLHREKSIRLISTSWPEESCKAIAKKGEKLELIKFKLSSGSVTLDRCADNSKPSDKVLYKMKDIEVTAVG